MKTIYLSFYALCFGLFISQVLMGQNIVPNPSFEDKSSRWVNGNKPTHYNQFHDKCANWLGFSNVNGTILISPDWYWSGHVANQFHEYYSTVFVPNAKHCDLSKHPGKVMISKHGQKYAGLTFQDTRDTVGYEAMQVELTNPIGLNDNFNLSFFFARQYIENDISLEIHLSNAKDTKDKLIGTVDLKVGNHTPGKWYQHTIGTFQNTTGNTYKYLVITNKTSLGISTNKYGCKAYVFLDDFYGSKNTPIQTPNTQINGTGCHLTEVLIKNKNYNFSLANPIVQLFSGGYMRVGSNVTFDKVVANLEACWKIEFVGETVIERGTELVAKTYPISCKCALPKTMETEMDESIKKAK